ncbi:hypothetical protein D3C80_1218690 [compost metagenome]
MSLKQAFDLVGFTAQANDQHGREIGVHGITGQGAAQQAQRLAAGVHGAPGTVGQCYYTVDVRVGSQRLGVDVPAEMIGHGPGHGRRAVHRSQDADIIAGGDSAIAAHDAFKEGFSGWRHMGIDAKGVIAGKIAHLHIVHMHVLTGFDRLRGKADNLPVATHRLALLHALGRNLVPGRNRLLHGDCFGLQPQAFRQGLARNQYIVQGIEANDGRVAAACSGNQLHGTSQGGAADFLLWRHPYDVGRICVHCKKPCATFPMR